MRGGKDGGGKAGQQTQQTVWENAVKPCCNSVLCKTAADTHHKYVLLHHKGHWGEGVEEAGGGGGGGGGRHMQVHEGLQDGH